MHSVDKFFNRWILPECLSELGTVGTEIISRLPLWSCWVLSVLGGEGTAWEAQLSSLESFQKVDILRTTGVRSSPPETDETAGVGRRVTSMPGALPTQHSRPLTNIC